MEPFLWLVLWLCLSEAQVQKSLKAQKSLCKWEKKKKYHDFVNFQPIRIRRHLFFSSHSESNSYFKQQQKHRVYLWIKWIKLWLEGFLPGHMTGQQESDCSQVSAQQFVCDDDDEELSRRAREEGRVDVVFPGSVTQDGCCRFVCELLKCVLYQRQQLPMTYDQMVFFQKQQLTTSQVRESGGTSKTPRLKHTE